MLTFSYKTTFVKVYLFSLKFRTYKFNFYAIQMDLIAIAEGTLQFN